MNWDFMSGFFKDERVPPIDDLVEAQRKLSVKVLSYGPLSRYDDSGDEILAAIECLSNLYSIVFQSDVDDNDPLYLQLWREFLLSVFTECDASGFKYGEYSCDGDARFQFIKEEEAFNVD